MALSLEKIVEIRRLYYDDNRTVTEIAERTGYSVNTIKKYLDMTNFNKSPTIPDPDLNTSPCPKLDSWKPVIDKWLTDDLSAPRKQRHTAWKVFEDLSKADANFNCSYRTVCIYVGYRKNLLGKGKDDAKLPLIHYPGECQGDFGEAVFIERGVKKKGKYFVLDFPYSNSGFSQLKYGENMECLLESMDAIFRHIGGVPPVIWFDNASTMVTEVIHGGKRKLTERFTRFLEHYHIKAVFMNRAKGNEKGGVESKVGYLRRNMLVPIPEFDDLDSFNDEYFQLQEDDQKRCHYRKGVYISELFKEDLAKLHALPSEQFDLADYRTYKTDPTGLFTIDGRYTYSSSPEYRRKQVMVKLTSKSVIILDSQRKEFLRFQRLYGEEPQISINWVPYLKAIARKPRSFFNTGLAELLPQEMRLFLYQCTNTDRGRILSIMAETADQYGFDEMLKLVQKAVERRAMDADNFELLYKRMYPQAPVLPALELSEKTPKLPSFQSDLSIYNQLLKQGKETKK